MRNPGSKNRSFEIELKISEYCRELRFHGKANHFCVLNVRQICDIMKAFRIQYSSSIFFVSSPSPWLLFAMYFFVVSTFLKLHHPLSQWYFPEYIKLPLEKWYYVIYEHLLLGWVYCAVEDTFHSKTMFCPIHAGCQPHSMTLQFHSACLSFLASFS